MGVVSPYGGAEFVVILPATDKESDAIVAKKLRKTVEKLKLEKGSAHGVLTVTMGVSNFPLDSVDAIELLETADKTLYHGKALGRNQVCGRTLDSDDD